MTPFRDVPIRRKVAYTVVLTSAIALLLTSAVVLGYEWITFRRDALTSLRTLSRIIAENTTAALRFNDQADAQDMLNTLRAEPDVLSAAIFDRERRLIAYYNTTRWPNPSSPPSLPPEGHLFEGNQLIILEPILHENRELGVLLMRTSVAAMQNRLLLYVALVVGILGTSSVVAFVLSSRLQRGITEPILELAELARSITLQGDYSRRAVQYGKDEIGTLTDAFNRMLDEIKEREQRLSASEERLRVALGAADMGTWRYYPDQRESMVDENFRRIYGLPPGGSRATVNELLAQIVPADRQRVTGSVERTLQAGEVQFSFEYRVMGADGTTRWVRDRGRVVRRDDGTVNYITGALVDITDRKAAEEEIQRLNAGLEQKVALRTAELEQANRELEAFTYSVSHDLRGPLRHISSYAEIVHDDPASKLSDEAVACLGRIGAAAIRLGRMVDSLLNLSRVGRRPLVLQRTSLDDLVTVAIRELEAETRSRKVEWKRTALPTVQCDPSLIHIVFVNLLSNAQKYSRLRETAVITIGTQVQDGETSIFVRDNGVGFDPRYQAKLFGVFERLHNATAFEGNGIGLATVDRIIRKHGGRIWAQGAVDQGATFSFTLPGLDSVTPVDGR